MAFVGGQPAAILPEALQTTHRHTRALYSVEHNRPYDGREHACFVTGRCTTVYM